MIPVNELSDAQLADEFGDVRLRFMAWRPEVNPDAQRYYDLSTQLLARQEGKPAAEQLLVEGLKWAVPISACEKKRTITKPVALFRRLKKLSEKRFLALYKITLGAIDKAIPDPKERARYVSEERTGPREIREPALREARPMEARIAA